MELVTTLAAWNAHRAQWQQRARSQRVGFVPTMGALHDGHMSLIERSRHENTVTVVSIFVNPTQFDDKKDLEAYPRTLDADLEMLAARKVDFVFAPSAREMYPNGYHYRVRESEVSPLLCGAHRPGHFDGMLTVVLKLLQIIGPTVAYFGEKDYQQLQLVKGLVESFFLPVEICGCPIVREPDGLAMSSRNKRLSPKARALAPRLFEILTRASASDEARTRLEREGFEVDYVEERWGRRLAAVRLGDVRLIDNVSGRVCGECVEEEMKP
jgi:pantoate--beta-alanine ligase